MLVLRRRLEETLIIDGDIEVRILEIDGVGNVKVGITAPGEVEIIRGELVSSGRWTPRPGRRQRENQDRQE